MAALLEIREQIKNYYARYDAYILPILKFLFAFITITLINSNLGYMERLNNMSITLIVALLCSFLPVNVLVFLAAVFSMAHIYALSLECAVVVLILYVLMILLYFKFSPSDALAVLVTPIMFMLHIPYCVPLICGFAGTPLTAIAAGFGVVIYYVLGYISQNASALGNFEAESTVQKFKLVIDNILSNKEMLVMVIAFAVTIVVVYTIRRLSVDHSWIIAACVGVVVDAIIVLFGDITFDISVSVVGIIFGSAVAFAMVLVLQFFIFSVDYSRTEHLQFEDDEYYYYVKAVPKMTVAVSEKKVKKISHSKKNYESPVKKYPKDKYEDDEWDRVVKSSRK